MKLNDKLFSTIRAATRNLVGKSPASGAKTAAAAIQDALKILTPHARQPAAPAMRDLNPPPQARTDSPQSAPSAPPFNMPKFDLSRFEMPSFDLPGMEDGAPEPPDLPGQFIEGYYTNEWGKRTFKLYVPSTYRGQPVPLVVMLHGCGQDPDDFATGTQMNQLAEEMECLVAYPAQSQQANPSRCWNWFSAADQQRDQGEPSIIAGITHTVMHNYRVDAAQVYVAGLSAGGAMATIMGTLYPDLYAAVGVHSGLPFASARDLPSALAAMQGNFGRPIPAGRAIPIIVFHGDRDTTVHPVNAQELIRQGAHPHAEVAVEPGAVPNGYSYTRIVHHSGDGTPHAEHWTIHGAGHAWSGGCARGSYTDCKGPDASREMMRFFTTKRQ
jgi:poly(hydroxyalkanoate) depolymerase family esterase